MIHNLKVFRKPMKIGSQINSSKPDRSVVSFYIGRFNIVAKAFYRVKGVEKQLNNEISTNLYFHQLADTFEICG